MIAHRRAIGIAISIGVLVVLAALLEATPARAATRSGTLDSAASASVLLAVDCADAGGGAPASLAIQVANLAPSSGALVSAQIRKGNLATNTTDPVDGDGNPSPAVFVNGGEGRYDVFVDKTAAGSEDFELIAQCWTGAGATGAPASTTIVDVGGGSVPTAAPRGLFMLGIALMTAASWSFRIRGTRRAR